MSLADQFYLFLFLSFVANYKDEMEASLRKCAKDCADKDECVVLTGHSQGGAIAAVAGLYVNDLNPYVITFGQPPTIIPPCEKISDSRWYRYINVNTKSGVTIRSGMSYDPVPFVPAMGAEFWGHMIILGDDSESVAWLGLDAQDVMHPLDVAGFEAHNMEMANGTECPGYLDRIESIMTAYENGSYPVFTVGYSAGSLCTQDKECESDECAAETTYSYPRCVGKQCESNDECETDRCDSGLCLQKLGSCMGKSIVRSLAQASACMKELCLHFPQPLT